MSSGAIFNIIGLISCMIGALILAIDALKAPVNWYSQYYFRGKLNGITSVRDIVLDSISKLKTPPYTPEEIKELEDNCIIQFNKSMEMAITEQDQNDLQERSNTFMRAAIGFGLVALGSLLQIISVIRTYN